MAFVEFSTKSTQIIFETFPKPGCSTEFGVRSTEFDRSDVESSTAMTDLELIYQVQ